MEEISYDRRKNEFSLIEINNFFNLALQVTKRCNLSCIHCCESDYVPDLEIEKMKEIVEAMAEHGTKRVSVTGGEPTVRQDLEEILLTIKNSGMDVTLATNGFRISRERLSGIAENISNIRLSLYGGEEAHDKIAKVAGSQREVLKTLGNSRDLGLPAYICTALMAGNLNELQHVVDVARDYGVNKIIAFSLMDKGRGHNLFQSERVLNKEVKRLISGIDQSDVKIYWTPFTREGQCVIVEPNSVLFGTPYDGNEDSKIRVGEVLSEGLNRLWERYPFKANYMAYYREKAK